MPVDPSTEKSIGVLQAWVCEGRSVEERRKRLAQCPDHMQARIVSHVKTVWAIRRYHESHCRNRKRP